MFQFFVKKSQVEKKFVKIYDEDFHHMKQVIRLKEQEKFRVSLVDDDHKSFFCLLHSYANDCAIGEILAEEVVDTELEGCLVLFQGLPKNDKMELIIQKAVELGIDTIVPVEMKHCVMKLDEKKEKAKQIRWQLIAETAAKQSKRSKIPTIEKMHNFQQAMDYANQLDYVCLPYENEEGIESTKNFLKKLKKHSSIGIFIGPEGGFSADEIDRLPTFVDKISLGKRILRTETAAIVTVAMIMLEIEMQTEG